MSKPIKLTESAVSGIIEEFRSFLSGLRTFGRISYEKNLAKTDAKTTLFFTPTAYMKMKYLVAVFDTECAWHGIVQRHGEDFLVTDILVYPQEVTGATVSTDQTKYQDWLFALDDEKFNSLRLHGHSHVNMGTSPSSVDIDHRQNLIQQVGDDDFYCFIIFNKKNEYTAAVYDFRRNTLFETADIEIKILGDDQFGFIELMHDAKDKISKRAAYSYSAGAYGSAYSSGAYGSTYSGGYVSNGTKVVQSAAAAVSPTTNKAPKKGKRCYQPDYDYDLDAYDFD